MKTKLRRCNATGRVIIHTELDAKLILAGRVWRDKGERGYRKCPIHDHYHLTASDTPQAVDERAA